MDGPSLFDTLRAVDGLKALEAACPKGGGAAGPRVAGAPQPGFVPVALDEIKGAPAAGR